MGDEDAAAHHDPPIVPLPDDRKQLNEWEKETLGLFLSSHPIKEVRPALRARVDCSLADLHAELAASRHPTASGSPSAA